MTLNCLVNARFQGLPAIPVTIAGRLDSPSVSLDADGLGKNLVKDGAGLVKDAAKSPQKLQNTINDVLDLFGGKKKK
jgi:hypothetical protein